MLKNASYLILTLLLAIHNHSNSVRAESFEKALSTGTISANIRYRFEDVEQDSLDAKAQASTLRTRLAYRTNKYKRFEFLIELDDVRAIGAANYLTPNAGALATRVGPKVLGHPVIADPLKTELNQVYVAMRSEQNTAILGRQRIIRANSRFVGNVVWRQHEQTFDGLSFDNTSLAGISFYAAYLKKRNTITFTELDLDTLLIDIKFDNVPAGALSVYYYDIQNDNSAVKWENIGLRYAGKRKSFNYALEYAIQENGTGNKPTYFSIEGGTSILAATVAIGIESLGSNNGGSFATPLATLHKFNGWADKFLQTPTEGLQDRYVKLGKELGLVKLEAVLHDFRSDKEGIDFGEELNLSAITKLSKKFSLGAKYAAYSAKDRQDKLADVNKFWLWAEAKF